MSKVYIVEDSSTIREAVAEYFRVNNHEVTEFGAAAGLCQAIRRQKPDAIILDVKLPDSNGFRLAKEIRAESEVPIIFLTVRSEESDRVMGFEVGADDYVVKPFSTKELLLRTQAVIRRSREPGSDGSERRSWHHAGKELLLDLRARTVSVDGNVLELTNSEFEILSFLALRCGWAVSRDQILEECLGYLYPSSGRTVDTHISNIRIRLGDSSWIDTVRGYGYRFSADEQH